MGLIKSINAPVGLTPFSMRDIENHARAIIAAAKQQADQLLAEAQSVGEALKAEAKAAGMATGKAEGLVKGLDEGRAAGHAQAVGEHRVRLTELVNALTSASADFDASRRQFETDALRDVIELSISIARRVTKRHAAIDDNVMTENLKEAMKFVVQATDVRIAIHPTQKQTLDAELPGLKLTWPTLRHVAIVEDETLARGGCRVFTSGGAVDADLDDQLDRVIADLLPEAVRRLRLSESANTERRKETIVTYLSPQLEAVDSSMPFRVVGHIRSVSGLTIEAGDLALPLGSLCRIQSFGGKTSMAEVIGFQHDHTLLMALSSVAGVARGDRVENVSAAPRIWCSEKLLGRVLNGFGQPIDGKGPLPLSESRRIDGRGVAPLERHNIREPISTSIRSIDALHTCGLGQRMGIFSGPGVGKSTLMSSIAKYTSADVSVVALIGERGREVQEFLENSLGEEGLKRCVVIVSTSDDAPLLRVRAAKVAATISEFFRDQGTNVLLLMDSLTRLAQAQRQIGLAAREPPATKGFPPSVFALMPEILERAGKTAKGSVTGFYTVLVEGDDFNEPIPDAVKGITDGHLWLSRALANRGHFPAIDVLQSISRVRGDVSDADHVRAARRVLALSAVYQDIEDLVNIGAYVPGVNPEFDLAVQSRTRIVQFLKQDSQSPCTLADSKKQLTDLATWIDQLERILKAQAAKSAPKQALAAAAR